MRRKIEFFWLIQYHCNYRCPYCVYDAVWPEVLARDRVFTPAEWLRAWERCHARYGEGRVTMTGGEPTAYSGFIELMDRLTDWFTVSFDTNLSLPMEKFEPLTRKLPPARVDWLTSFHPDTVTPDDFIAKARLLKERGHSYVCRLVAHPPRLKDIPALRRRFEEAGLLFVVNPFQGDYQGRRYPDAYTEEERALILGELREGSHAAIAAHNINIHTEKPTGRLCRSGSEHAYIGVDGIVYRCFQYSERRWEPFGSFLAEDFRLWDEPKECRSPVCEWEYRWLVDEAERFQNV